MESPTRPVSRSLGIMRLGSEVTATPVESVHLPSHPEGAPQGDRGAPGMRESSVDLSGCHLPRCVLGGPLAIGSRQV